MYNPIPVFEAKNKLPYFLHLAETDGPIPIMRHNNVVAYIISKNDYEQIRNENKPQKSLVQKCRTIAKSTVWKKMILIIRHILKALELRLTWRQNNETVLSS